MRRTLRLSIVIVGLAAIVYGIASVTGGWLGTPPWWERAAPIPEHEVNEEWLRLGLLEHAIREGESTPSERKAHRDLYSRMLAEALSHTEPCPGHEWISASVTAVGLGLAAVGAWPRWRREATS